MVIEMVKKKDRNGEEVSHIEITERRTQEIFINVNKINI